VRLLLQKANVEIRRNRLTLSSIVSTTRPEQMGLQETKSCCDQDSPVFRATNIEILEKIDERQQQNKRRRDTSVAHLFGIESSEA
jgi:hypothetical protein